MVVESKISQASSILDRPPNEFYNECAATSTMKPKIMATKEISEFGGSSEEHGSLKMASDSLCHDLLANNLTSTAPSTPPAIINEDKESWQDDTAIDTDNTDWEDSNEEENSKSGGNETMFFQRIQLRANPPPQRESLLTLALRSTQHHGPTPRLIHVPKYTFTDVQRARTPLSSMKNSPGESNVAPIRIRQKPRGAARQSLNDVGRSSAQPIPLTSNGAHEPVVFFPRTARRNMIATELTEPLSRHIRWEREEKYLTGNAVLKRRHTHTHGDMTTLDQHPQRSHTTQDNSDNDAYRWDPDFTWDAFGGYHTKGW